VGRSVAQFLLPNVSAEWVLQAAVAYGAVQGMRLATATANQIVLTKGSIWWTGERWLSVAAWNVPGGANVLVEAWIEGMGQLNADPGATFGFVPRRDMWYIASMFVARLGVVPEAVFRHF
jgi:hypothetical protein